MNIETTPIKCLKITEIDYLDPITVFIENIKPKKGKVTIECFGKSWTCFWTSMPCETVEDFLLLKDEDYIVGKLSDIPSLVPVKGQELRDYIRESIQIAKEDGRIDENEAKVLIKFSTFESADQIPDCFIMQIFGDSAYFSPPHEDNPEYDHLCRIVGAVKKALMRERQEGLSC